MVQIPYHHGLGSAIWASKSVADRLFLDHLMVILNKKHFDVMTDSPLTDPLYIIQHLHTVQMRAWSLFRSNWKWLVISCAQSSSFSYPPGHRRGLHCTIPSRTGIYPTFWHLAVARSHFKKLKRGLFHITKRAIIEQVASTEQNQSQISSCLPLVHHFIYSKLWGNGLDLFFKPWITLPSISPITCTTGDSRR